MSDLVNTAINKDSKIQITNREILRKYVNIIKGFILGISWIFLIYFNQNSPDMFFISNFIYATTFCYDALNASIAEDRKYIKYLPAISFFVICVFSLFSILWLTHVLKIEKITKNGIENSILTLNLLVKINIIPLKGFMFLTVIMPVLSFMEFGCKRK